MELTFLKSKFRERFKELPVDRDEQTLKWYVRAYILDLLSSSLFADSSGDVIPLWYLDLIVNLDQPVQYNWGGAVLAYLYRHLCVATGPDRGSMHGPVMLLQHWSWTRFPVLRPEPQTKNWEPTWGAPTLDTCASFAYKWCGPHKYVSSSHFKSQGSRIPRGQFQSLTEDRAIWEPYGRVYNKLPIVTQAGQPYYLYRGPLIFYWIVEHTYPDRCMRQFGLFQEIPVPDPLNRHTHVELHK